MTEPESRDYARPTPMGTPSARLFEHGAFHLASEQRDSGVIKGWRRGDGVLRINDWRPGDYFLSTWNGSFPVLAPEYSLEQDLWVDRFLWGLLDTYFSNEGGLTVFTKGWLVLSNSLGIPMEFM